MVSVIHENPGKLMMDARNANEMCAANHHAAGQCSSCIAAGTRGELSPPQYREERAICDKANAYWDEHASGSSMSAELAAHPDYAACTNDIRGRVEQYETLNAAEPAERLFVYYSLLDSRGLPLEGNRPQPGEHRVKLTVWTGLTLGFGRIGKPYESNMGDKRASVEALIGGRKYHGTLFLTAGDYGRLKLSKESR